MPRAAAQALPLAHPTNQPLLPARLAPPSVQTAHVGALYPAFLAMMLTAGGWVATLAGGWAKHKGREIGSRLLPLSPASLYPHRPSKPQACRPPSLSLAFMASSRAPSNTHPPLLPSCSAGVPAIIAALSLAFMTNLFSGITHYSSGPAAVYYGSGYLSLVEVFEYGALMGLLNLLLWGGLGCAWWSWLGLMPL